MDDAAFYRERGFGGTAGFGRRPALLVIDLVNGFTDPASPLGSDLDSVVAADGTLDESATEAERTRQRDERGDALAFDFGPSLEEALENCLAETGLEPPTPAKPLRWSPLEPGDVALKRVRDADAAAAAAGD